VDNESSCDSASASQTHSTPLKIVERRVLARPTSSRARPAEGPTAHGEHVVSPAEKGICIVLAVLAGGVDIADAGDGRGATDAPVDACRRDGAATVR
jgi:hypothetical protein